MIIRNVNLETVCGITSPLPENHLPEIAFAGKSNVGKSSLINGLMNRKALARISATPGKTRHAPSANDKMMYQWIVAQGFHPIIIATKLDKIKRSQKDKQLKLIRQGLDLVPGTVIIPYSSVTKQGRDEIWDLVETRYLQTDGKEAKEDGDKLS